MLDKSQNEPDYAKLFVDDYDTRLPGKAFKFDWQKLGQIDDECMLVALNQRQIAWLEDIIGRLTHSGYYNEPDYIAALWGIDSQHGDWYKIQEFSEELRYCLMVGCKVSELVNGVNDINTTLKYMLAAISDGQVRDFLYDPARPEVFAKNVGVSVDDLPKYDLNPTDGDIFHPNLYSFDEIGNSLITDPVTGTTWSTTRRMVEEVPSVFIYDGWTDDTTIAEMYAQTMYFNVGAASIPFMEGLTNNLERIDLVLRHLDAKLSRSGRLDLNLPDVPQIRNPLTGERVELGKILDEALANGGSWLGVTIPPVFAEGAPWPLLAYTKPSVFTAGAPRSDDPLGVNEETFNTDTYVGEILANGLLANWRPTIRLSEGLAPILEFPALDIPLPGNLGNISIPAIPLYAGTYEGVIPGESGRGLAYLLKQEEEPVITSVDLPVIGTVLFRWQRDKLAIKLPKLPTVPGFSKQANKFISFLFGQTVLNGLTPNKWVVIWPKMRSTVDVIMREYDVKLEGKGLGQLFKDILQIQVPNPQYDPDDSTKGGKTKDGKTLAELFWIEATKESGELGKSLPGKSFAQLFNLEVDDPNYRSYVQTHAQILNYMEKNVKTALAELTKAINDCCQGGGNSNDIGTIIEAINDNLACLTLTQQAMNAAIGGDDVDCLPVDTPPTDPTDPTDCEALGAVYDELVNILDWLVWGVETVGGTVAGPIVNALVKFRWFTAILVAVGLVEPSPAEEVVTVPLALVATLTYVVEKSIELGAEFARNLVDDMKANRDEYVNLLCGATAGDIDQKIDEVIDNVTEAFSDASVKEIIQDMLDHFLKSPEIKEVLL